MITDLPKDYQQVRTMLTAAGALRDYHRAVADAAADVAAASDELVDELMALERDLALVGENAPAGGT
jgi:hypothetical protein